HYLQDAARELGTPEKSLNGEALERLTAYEWPGNVRQLVNTARRLTVTAPGSVITSGDLPPELGGTTAANGALEAWTRTLGSWAEQQLARAGEPLLRTALPEVEKVLIHAALKQARGHRQEAARLLGWGRNTLTRKMRALKLDPAKPDDPEGAAGADHSRGK